MEAGEPEERAAEEKEVEEKSGERKAEKIGSEAKESSGDVAVVMVVVVVVGPLVVVDLKVERRCRGEEDEVGERCIGTAGNAIGEFLSSFWTRQCWWF